MARDCAAWKAGAAGPERQNVTESGQEPPVSGRRTADESGNSGTRSEFKGSNRRRRKRRKGQGPQGKLAGPDNVAAAPTQGAGEFPAQAVTGIVANQNQAQAQAVQDGSIPSAPSKRRRKRRRGRSDQTGAGHGQGVQSADHSQAVSGQPGTDTFTSPKGKKAANRRGRKRWQASKNTKSSQTTKRDEPLAKEAAASANDGTLAVEETIRDKNALQKEGFRPTSSRDEATGVTRNEPGKRRAHTGQHKAPLYAALDLGTNNCRLLIARPEVRGFRVVDAYSRIVRLGEGVGSNKLLSAAAMDRAIDALANCHRKLADRGVLRSRLIATEACRAAENGIDFIDRVKAETGLALEVVNRETEARLAVAGCASLVDHDADGVILFDIGGGSSEIVWLDLRNRCGARGYALTRFIRSWISLPVGVVNLAERHGGVHVTPDIFEAMVEDAADHLAAFSLADNLSEAISSGRVHMLGTSGTVTTLAGVHLGLRRYDRRRVDGTWLDDNDVAAMIEQLRHMPYEARVENPCIGADRADLVLAGCAILEAIRRRWSCSRLRVADRGLREGILTELMAADGVWANRRSGKRQDRRRQRNAI